MITGLGADVVALQELDRGRERSSGMDQPRLLAELTGLEVSFHPTLSGPRGDYGQAIASTEELDSRFEILPGTEGEEPRGVIVTELDGFTILATHVATKRASADLQLARLAAIAAGSTDVVLAGDLNRSPRGLGVLAEAGLRPAPGGRRSTYGRGPLGREIDHVLAGRGALAVSAQVTATSASDHRPVAARIVS